MLWTKVASALEGLIVYMYADSRSAASILCELGSRYNNIISQTSQVLNSKNRDLIIKILLFIILYGLTIINIKNDVIIKVMMMVLMIILIFVVMLMGMILIIMIIVLGL